MIKGSIVCALEPRCWVLSLEFGGLLNVLLSALWRDGLMQDVHQTRTVLVFDEGEFEVSVDSTSSDIVLCIGSSRAFLHLRVWCRWLPN